MKPLASKNGTALPSLFLSFAILCIISLSIFFFFSPTQTPNCSVSALPSFSSRVSSNPDHGIKVYVADLPRSLNYGLLHKYWSLKHDSRLGSDADNNIRSALASSKQKPEFPPYPENPLIKQYSAEYWILGDLMTPQESRGGSFAKRVLDVDDADVVFVPFFATLSAEMQLGIAKGMFRKKVGNEDYERQKQVVDVIRSSKAWKRSGGRDHVFVLTGCVKCSSIL